MYGKGVARLLSLDALRGITVAAMVLVNNPGTWRAVYPPLRHADWHGWTPTDLVFPFFLFIVGVSIPLSLGRRAGEGRERPVLARVLRRSAVIFLLGIVLNGFPWFDWATLRIPGVLQRIALCYLAAALIYLATGWRGQAWAAAGLLLGYWALMTLVPVPGYGAGDLGKAGSLAAYIDRTLLGSAHLWQQAKVYDPEGLLSTLPAIATTLLGVLAGGWVAAGRSPKAVAAGLAVAGLAAAVLGAGWGLWFPINKALWTSSYALFTAGLAAVTLSGCYWLVEARGFRRWAWPFAWFGVNALALFFLSTLAAKVLLLVRVGPEATRLHAWLFERLFATWAASLNASLASVSLAWALAYVLIWWGAMWLMFRLGLRLRA
jgi:predicted acyltransferase